MNLTGPFRYVEVGNRQGCEYVIKDLTNVEVATTSLEERAQDAVELLNFAWQVLTATRRFK